MIFLPVTSTFSWRLYDIKKKESTSSTISFFQFPTCISGCRLVPSRTSDLQTWELTLGLRGISDRLLVSIPDLPYTLYFVTK